MAEKKEEPAVEEAEGGVARARQRLQSVRDDIKVQAGKAKEVARERYEGARENLKQGYGTARESLKQGYDKARKDFDQLTDDVGVYVRDNPGRSVLIAAGIGFLIGFLVRTDRRRS